MQRLRIDASSTLKRHQQESNGKPWQNEGGLARIMEAPELLDVIPLRGPLVPSRWQIGRSIPVVVNKMNGERK